MTRFFFDIASKGVVYHDYHGRDLARAEEAHELAQLIALDLACKGEEGNEVLVRDQAGKKLFCVPAGQQFLAA